MSQAAGNHSTCERQGWNERPGHNAWAGHTHRIPWQVQSLHACHCVSSCAEKRSAGSK